MADDDSKVYQLELPDELSPIDEWLCKYGHQLNSDELTRLVHFQDQKLPGKQFIVWCNRALQGRSRGWILKDVAAVRVLWHSLGNKRSDLNWYFIDKTLAMAFTDAPAF